MTDPSVTERWLPVVGYEGIYSVSDRGRVKSLARTVARVSEYGTPSNMSLKDRVLKIATDDVGRCRVHLHVNTTVKTIRVHRLVLTAFVGACPDGMVCCHWDGDPSNNHLTNLRWDTPENNCRDMIRHGTSNRGQRNHFAKLTESDVIEIRRLRRCSNLSCREIGEMYNVAASNVSLISGGATWAWLK